MMHNDNASGRAQNRRVELVAYGAGGSTSTSGGDVTYTTISMQKLVNDATAEVTSGDASYTTRSYQKLVSDATSENATTDAKYTTVSYQKLANDASANVSSGDARYTTRTYRKLASPATTTSNSTEARYESRSYQTSTAPTTRTVDIPAEYKTVSKRQLVKAGGFSEWKEVLCGDKITTLDYREIQQALVARGYDVGGVDGTWGAKTKAALVKFQKDNGLPIGQLDFDTLRALGIDR